MNAALILSGGVGNRFGGGVPKQYLEVAGRMIVEYVIEAAAKARSVDKVVVAASPPYEFLLSLKDKYGFELTPSGKERNDTIRLGLDYIKRNYACENIAVIDSARPLTTSELIDHLMEKLGEYEASIQARRISDSLARYGQQDVNRAEYYIVQTPECFRFDLFDRHFEVDAKATCLLNHLPPDANSYLYFDFIDNLKMTYPSDLDFLEYMLNKRRKG
ncbi:MAG: NTP transferase domain-containing protein [Clostridiales bacterium]|jgi:2-C-methyl-D-erythritol 4-phosphate cytidylyltransferase|nr:NTP transferase domain-containing protein [Clostridiales bacterium]OPZ68794.1 MAG: 2-C-methyl-D-erythritol 4-phosphate cytidylyltransferase [Firmicutes bacterium ADurb.Bin467]